MIVEYDSNGKIFHIIHDPVPPHMAGFLRENGHRFLDLPPVPWPPEPQFDEGGKPLLDEDGTQMIASNGMDSVPCDIVSDYVVDGELNRRPACSAVIKVEGRTISIADLPEGSMTTMTLDGVSVPVEDTTIEIDEPGPITIAIIPPWPYMEVSHDLEIE